MAATQTPEKVAIFFELEGEHAKQFLKYKKEQFIRGNAEAARKLALERLSQIQTEKTA
jgi:hypothetical protein